MLQNTSKGIDEDRSRLGQIEDLPLRSGHQSTVSGMKMIVGGSASYVATVPPVVEPVEECGETIE